MNRHVEALAEEFLGRGHDVRVLAPVDPPGRISRVLHRRRAEPRELPDYLIPLGRTVGFGANGSVSNLAPFPAGGVARPAPRGARRASSTSSTSTSRWCRWSAGTRRLAPRTPVGRHLPRLLDQAGAQLHRQRRSAPAASSTASRPGSPSPRPPPGPAGAGTAATTRSSPTGSTSTPPRAARSSPGEELRILFVGRPEERKGLPILLDRLRRPGRARALPADRDRRRARGRPPLPRRPRD